jgi:hypothetical protein
VRTWCWGPRRSGAWFVGLLSSFVEVAPGPPCGQPSWRLPYAVPLVSGIWYYTLVCVCGGLFLGFELQPSMPLRHFLGRGRVAGGWPKPQCAVRSACDYDQLRDQRGQGPGGAVLATVRPLGPVSSEELGWAGCGPGGPTWPLGRWVRWPVAPDPDRHRGWVLCPSAVPAAGGRGLRPRVFSAHRPGPQLQAPSACPGTGCNSASFGRAPSDRPSLPSSSHFYNLARCADSDLRSSANQGRGSPFRHTGCTTQ